MATFMMHMADGLVSGKIGILFLVLSALAIAYTLFMINRSHDESKIPMMAVVGAFVFAAQMINFTIPGTGSSGHICGGILLCMILGQYPAFLSLSCVLIIQCLFFGDGGLLALGCNIFNMALLPCFVAYPLIVKPILKKSMDQKNIILGSILGCVIGLEMGAFCVVLETLASSITSLPFSTFVGLMLPIHLAIGLVEGLITAAVVSYVYKENPQMLDQALMNQAYSISSTKKLAVTFVIVSLLVGGGLSIFASSNPDGLEWSILNVTGDTEVESSYSIQDAFGKVQEKFTFIPDYQLGEGILGGSSAGLVGVAGCVFAIGAVGYLFTKKGKHE